jgi:hypothetical protein
MDSRNRWVAALAWVVTSVALLATLRAGDASAPGTVAPAAGSDQAAELAKKLANPVANLISLPLQFNYDENYGLDGEGSRSFINVQPVIPISLSADWNVISRTIMPLINQEDMPYGTEESGLGDIVQSFFFSPKEPTSRGWIWGAGPVFLLPTATEQTLGGEKWGAGPTAVLLKQSGPWTVGMLASHTWSFAGDDDRADVNATFVQPFASYLFRKTYTTVGLNTETTYNWDAEDSDDAWSVPVNLTVSQMLKIGKQPIQLTIGPRYWAASPDAGPEGWGARVALTFLFPK